MLSGSSSLVHAAPMAPLLSFSPTSADYPNHLAMPEPERLRLPPARWLLALLVLLCLAPRAVMALRVPSICCDGVTLYQHRPGLGGGQLPRRAFRRGRQHLPRDPRGSCTAWGSTGKRRRPCGA